jgi:hypothetical protein
MKRYFVYLTTAGLMLLAAWPATSAPNPKTPDAIWVVNAGARISGQLRYGGTFSAGWQSSRTQYPWGLARCWVSGSAAPFWSSYRALQGDGTIGVFELASADPSASWPAGGASCTVSLIVNQGNRQVVTATSDPFPVSP